MKTKEKTSSIGLLTLLASSSTLICCALPALFVALGAGATFASIVSVFPQLIIVSKYKIYISLFTLVVLVLAGFLIKKAQLQPCPIDPALREACITTRKRSMTLYNVSLTIFMLASLFTYILPLYL